MWPKDEPTNENCWFMLFKTDDGGYEVHFCANKKQITIGHRRKNGRGMSALHKVDLPVSVMQALVEDWLIWPARGEG